MAQIDWNDFVIVETIDLYDELAAQCARAIRNLSVNRKYYIYNSFYFFIYIYIYNQYLFLIFGILCQFV